MSDPVAAALAALAEPSPSSRLSAMRALAELPADPRCREAIPRLKRQLGRPRRPSETELRIAAAEALICLDEEIEAASAVLATALQAESEAERRAAIRTVAFAGKKLRRATPGLATLIASSADPAEAREAIDAVRLAGTDAERVVQSLAGRLAEPGLAENAVRALAAIGHRSGLLTALTRVEPRLLAATLEALAAGGDLGDDIVPLATALGKRPSDGWWRASESLRRLLGPAALAALADALTRADQETARGLIGFLRQAPPPAGGGRPLAEAILTWLRRLPAEPGLWHERWLETAPTETLLDLTRDPTPSLRRLGWEGLRRTPAAVLPEIPRGLGDDEPMVARAALRTLVAAGRRAVPLLVEQLGGDPESRATALDALLTLAPERPETRGALRAAAAELSFDRMTVRRLREIAGGPLGDELVGALERSAMSAPPERRAAAVASLGAVPTPAVLDRLEAWLDDGDADRSAGATLAIDIASEHDPDAVRSAGILDRRPAAPGLELARWRVTGRFDEAIPRLLEGRSLLDLKYDDFGGGVALPAVRDLAPPAVTALAEIVAGSPAALLAVERAAADGSLYRRLRGLWALALAGASAPAAAARTLDRALAWSAARERADPYTGEDYGDGGELPGADRIELRWIDVSAVACALAVELDRTAQVLPGMRAAIELAAPQSSYFRERDAIRRHGLRLCAQAGPIAVELAPAVVEGLEDPATRRDALAALVAIRPELGRFQPGLRAAMEVDSVRSRLLPRLAEPALAATVASSLGRFAGSS